MEWIDEGLVLSARPHGETAMIATVLTARHGAYAGLVAGGQSRSRLPTLQAGTLVKARWHARLPEHLGNYTLETQTALSARWLCCPEILALIASACALVEASLPERQPMPALFDSLNALFSLEDESLWAPASVRWEVGLLEALGYGLDLSRCALTGACSEKLSHVSPRTGRAVTETAAAPYLDKLLPLPSFLTGSGTWDTRSIADGLALTGHFLRHFVFAHPQNRRLVPIDGSLPAARERLEEFYRARAEEAAEDAAAAEALCAAVA